MHFLKYFVIITNCNNNNKTFGNYIKRFVIITNILTKKSYFVIITHTLELFDRAK